MKWLKEKLTNLLVRGMNPVDMVIYQQQKKVRKAIKLVADAQKVVDDAEKLGLIITIERVQQQPFAMRNHIAVIDVREKLVRDSDPK